MSTLPHWARLLRDRIAREVPGFGADFDAALTSGANLDSTRVPILARILEEIALPAVTLDRWGARDAIRGVTVALQSGDEEALRRARRSAVNAAEAAGWANWTAEALNAAEAVTWAAWTAVPVTWAAEAVTWTAEAAAKALHKDVWRRIADIVLEEVTRTTFQPIIEKEDSHG